jgi:hypothetical protein
VTGTRQDSQEPESAATAADGRRGNQAYLALSPPRGSGAGPTGDDKRPNETRATTNPTAEDRPEAPPHDFIEAQRAGLATVIGLARAEPPAQTPAVGRPPAPASSPRGPSSSPASASPASIRPTPKIAAAAAQTERSVADMHPAQVPPDLLPATGARPDRQHRAVWSSTFAYFEFPLLMAVLTTQAVLSLRLVWSNTASHDEAVCLSAGHVELQGWLHGTPIPAYATFFPGAPVIYPPIGAIADGIGGLAAARLLSLLFMLGATTLLWSMSSRLFGRKAAVCAAALFAVLGPTLQLGALATFDAMGLCLLAASAWCMVASRDRDDSAFLLVVGTLFLVLADATAYMTILLDPSVIALAGLTVWARNGRKAFVARSGYVAAGTLGLVSALLAIGGPLYLAGALNATVSQSPGSQSALLVLTDAWRSAGLVCVIALAGLALAALCRQGRVQLVLLPVLLVSGVLGPLNEARVRSAAGLSTYIDFGIWFAAAGAGYALAQVSQIGRWRALRLAVAGLALLCAVLPAGIMGRSQASRLFGQWPNSADLTADLLSLTHAYPGNYLAEDDTVPAYYLESTVSWQRWSDTAYFKYTPPHLKHSVTGIAAYQAAISRHYFRLIILNFSETVQTDGEIVADMDQAGGYQVVRLVPSSIGHYTIWVYEPSRPSRGGS